MRTMRIVAYLVALVSAWLGWGALSLHQKDPGHYGLILPVSLWVVAALFLAVGYVCKTPATARR